MNHFEIIDNFNQLDQFLAKHHLTFLFISQPNCSVCISLFPQVEKILINYPLIKSGYINTKTLPDIAGRLSIFTVPVLLLFVGGKEYVREARIVPLEGFEVKIKKIYDAFA